MPASRQRGCLPASFLPRAFLSFALCSLTSDWRLRWCRAHILRCKYKPVLSWPGTSPSEPSSRRCWCRAAPEAFPLTTTVYGKVKTLLGRMRFKDVATGKPQVGLGAVALYWLPTTCPPVATTCPTATGLLLLSTRCPAVLLLRCCAAYVPDQGSGHACLHPHHRCLTSRLSARASLLSAWLPAAQVCIFIETQTDREHIPHPCLPAVRPVAGNTGWQHCGGGTDGAPLPAGVLWCGPLACGTLSCIGNDRRCTS